MTPRLPITGLMGMAGLPQHEGADFRRCMVADHCNSSEQQGQAAPSLPGCVLSARLFDFFQAQLPDMSTVTIVDGMALWTEPVCMECRWCYHHR